MPRFAANITFLFTEHPFLDRFAAARAAGFAAVECLFPYDHDPQALRRALKDAGLHQVLVNTPPGDWEAGERGLGAVAGAEIAFRQGVLRAFDYARALEAAHVHVMAGIADPQSRQAEALFVANLKWAAEQASETGLGLLIEPLNPHDQPGYFLATVEQAARIVDAVGAPNLAIQYDIYHQSRHGGDIIGTYRRHAPQIAHIQISANPGRHEPDTGEIDCANVFRFLDEAGYDGWIGAEYIPAGRTEDGLGWFAPWRDIG